MSAALTATLLFYFIAFDESLAADSIASISDLSLRTIHQQPFFIEVMMASIIGWILGITKGFSTSRDWLSNYLQTTPIWVTFIVDLFIFVVVGAYIGTGLYQPNNFVAALGAGITWPIALGALATKPPQNDTGG